MDRGAWRATVHGVSLSPTQLMHTSDIGQTHTSDIGEGSGSPSRVAAWEIPRTEEPDGLCPWVAKELDMIEQLKQQE